MNKILIFLLTIFLFGCISTYTTDEGVVTSTSVKDKDTYRVTVVCTSDNGGWPEFTFLTHIKYTVGDTIKIGK